MNPLFRPFGRRVSSGVVHPRRLAVLVAAASLSFVVPSAMAAISWTGDVDPADPTAWTGSTDSYVGKTADGTLAVDGDSDLETGDSSIGFGSSSTGAVTVDGAGTTWNIAVGIAVGASGSGQLAITNGGVVNSTPYGSNSIGNGDDSTGFVTVDGVGSAWNIDKLAVGYDGSGTLAIRAHLSYV